MDASSKLHGSTWREDMTIPVDPNNSGIKVGDTLSGYTVLRIVHLTTIDAVFYELEHIKTHARHIHISNGDRENTFSVAFKTVPSDSTGVAHIIEHTVLCGSKKYPVHDPFFSMLKRSLNTFMNAFTAPDWTMYPFSTQNEKDYYNLMNVYLDAVFYPNLDELSFKQEGHRLELEAVPDPSALLKLSYKGVVYNEMKGAMSSPRQVMGQSLMNALYPSTTYRHNSGGDPAEIPRLTYDRFKSFHRRYYHPSNAYFYTYGNFPLKEHLRFIDDILLRHFDLIDPETDVYPQPRWDSPTVGKANYPLEKNEDPAKKHQVCVAWLTADIKDSFEILILYLLEHILLGNSASPLRKALIDSGLGTALSDGTGFDAECRDSLFACGLKNVEKSSEPKIQKIIFDTLTSLVENGIDPELIEAAIHQTEFHQKEITNSPYPYGLKLLLSFSGSWFHSGDPVDHLEIDALIGKIRQKLVAGPIFEEKIKQYFLDNPHRVLFTLSPDQQMVEQEEVRVSEELDKILSNLNDKDIKKIKSDTRALMQQQTIGEDVSCLPTLEKKDIPASIIRVIPSAVDDTIPVQYYTQPTAGIFYFCSGIGVGSLEKQLVPLMPFFCFSLPRMGTRLRSYTEMARRIDAYTGGLGMSVQTRTGFDAAGRCIPFISLNGKCLERNQEPMFSILQELISQYDFSDLLRLKNLLLEYKTGLESMIVPSGNRLAVSLSSRNFSLRNALSECWHGIQQLKTIKALAEDLSDEKLAFLSNQLTVIARTIFTGGNIKTAVTGEDRTLSTATPYLVALGNGLADYASSKRHGNEFGIPDIDMGEGIPREGWSTTSAVSFVATTFQTIRMGHEDAAAMSVIGRMLRSLVVHREVREKGGAYGGYANYSADDGMFSFSSYRDPHIVATLNAFQMASSFIPSGNFSEEDVKEAILQVCSDIDRPLSPGAAGNRAFTRTLVGLTDEMRESFKKQLLTLTRDQVIAVGKRYFTDLEGKQAVAVISGEDKLKAANEKLIDRPLKLFKI